MNPKEMSPKELLLATADSVENGKWHAEFCSVEESGGCMCVLEHMSNVLFGTPAWWGSLDVYPVSASAVKTLASTIKRPGIEAYIALEHVYEWNDQRNKKGLPARTQAQVVGALRRAAARRGNK